MAQFEMDTFAKSHDHMSNFWNACYDAMMSSSQRREQEKAASRKMFQVLPATYHWDLILAMCSSAQGDAPHPKDGIQGTSPCSQDVILGTCSSPWGY